MSAQSSKDNALLARSLSSVKSLIGLQLVSRLFTFALNQGLVRLASPQAYGTVAIQFELFLSTVLFLSREGVRNSLLRVWPQQEFADKGSKRLQTIQCSNLATLPALLGIPMTLLTVVLYTHAASDAARNQPHFHLALFTYAVAAITELMSEPMHNRAMGEVRTGIRVRAEGAGISTKTLVTYAILLYERKSLSGSGPLALIAFALGQLSYSIVVFIIYLLHMPKSPIWPVRLPQQHSGTASTSRTREFVAGFFDPDILYLSINMTSQSIVKHILTEGDKFLVSWWSPLQDQGGYAIAVNYGSLSRRAPAVHLISFLGSLLARIVFQPIEESCRVYFSRMLATPTSLSESRARAAKDEDLPSPLRQASDAIASLLSIQVVFSLLVTTFGSLYLPILLQILLPSQYISTSAPTVLSAWIWYIPFLAINGGLEAVYSSAATPEDLRTQSWWMLGFSALYILSAISMYRLGFGDTSLVYANMINLSARIWYTATFILRYFKQRTKLTPFGLADLAPSWKFLVVLCFSYVAVSLNEARQRPLEHVQSLGRKALFSVPVLAHIGLGLGMALVCAATWWMITGKQLVRRRIKVD
ncbi:Rft protein-domain-containing protein [Phlebopus sp. FC_14]|nr:Rft protein-domain-containing protein [Phlebopus sp. FC_14]